MKKIIILILSLLLFIKDIRFLLLFIVPGIIFNKKKRLPIYLIQVVGISLSFWIVSFWFLKYIPIQLTTFFYVILFLSFVVLNFKPFLFSKKLKFEDVFVITLILLVIIIRLVPFLLNYFPAGADMSFHTLTTRIITLNNSVPVNYEPVLPINFGNYPVGFHAISAYINLISGLIEYKATLLLANFTYAFLTLASFIFLRKYFKPIIAFLSALFISFLANNPQFFISWGGNPFVLSICFLILAISSIEKLPKNKLLSALYLASSFLIHPMPVYGFFYIYLPVFIYRFMKNKNLIKAGLSMALIFILFITPFMLNFNYIVSDTEFQWTKQRQETKYLSWKGEFIPKFLITLFGEKIVFLVLISTILLFNKKELFIKIILMYVSTVVLIINSKYWILPFSQLLWSERVGMLLIIPMSVAFGYLIKIIFDIKFYEKHVTQNKVFIRSIQGFFIISLLILSFNNYQHYIRVSNIFSMVTQEDLDAFDWILNNTEEDALFLNNYGDAGLWISPITLRKTRIIQMVPIYMDETEKYLSSLQPEYVYIGNKQVYSINLDVNSFISDPSNYEQVYKKNDVMIFKIK